MIVCILSQVSPRIIALVVKWISHQSSELMLGVRVPPRAQDSLSRFCKKRKLRYTEARSILRYVSGEHYISSISALRVSFSGRTRPCQGRGGSSILPTRTLYWPLSNHVYWTFVVARPLLARYSFEFV